MGKNYYAKRKQSKVIVESWDVEPIWLLELDPTSIGLFKARAIKVLKSWQLGDGTQKLSLKDAGIYL